MSHLRCLHEPRRPRTCLPQLGTALAAMAAFGSTTGCGDQAQDASDSTSRRASALQVTGAFATGVDALGDARLAGAAEQHYSVTSSADPSYPPPNAIIATTQTSWVTPPASARWITVSTEPQAAARGGNYDYTVHIHLADVADRSQLALSGRWACDDSCTLLVNDILVASRLWTEASQPAGTLAYFFVPANPATLFETDTVLRFTVNNVAAGSATNATGLLVSDLVLGERCTVDGGCPIGSWCNDTGGVGTGICQPKSSNGVVVPGGSCGLATRACASGICVASTGRCAECASSADCTAMAAKPVCGGAYACVACNGDYGSSGAETAKCPSGSAPFCNLGIGTCSGFPEASVDADASDAGVIDDASDAGNDSSVSDATGADGASAVSDADAGDADAGDADAGDADAGDADAEAGPSTGLGGNGSTGLGGAGTGGSAAGGASGSGTGGAGGSAAGGASGSGTGGAGGSAAGGASGSGTGGAGGSAAGGASGSGTGGAGGSAAGGAGGVASGDGGLLAEDGGSGDAGLPDAADGALDALADVRDAADGALDATTPLDATDAAHDAADGTTGLGGSLGDAAADGASGGALAAGGGGSTPGTGQIVPVETAPVGTQAATRIQGGGCNCSVEARSAMPMQSWAWLGVVAAWITRRRARG